MTGTEKIIYHCNDGKWEGRYVKGKENNKTLYGYVYGGSFEEVDDKLSNIAIYKLYTPKDGSLFNIV